MRLSHDPPEKRKPFLPEASDEGKKSLLHGRPGQAGAQHAAPLRERGRAVAYWTSPTCMFWSMAKIG
jgi:hypothetical protein